MPLIYDSITIETLLNVDTNGHILGTQKGDMIVDNGTQSSVLSVGSDGKVVVADSSDSLGVKWSTVGNAGLSSGLDVSKLADGSVSNASFQYLAGLGSAAVGVSETQTLTNKTWGDDLNMNNYKITNLAEPVSASDAANKSYVDAVATGLDLKQSVKLATTGALSANASVSSVSYSNTGGASTRGQFTGTLAVTNTFTVDGVSLTSSNNGARVLVKDQASGDQNGIYTVTISGTSLTLNRATDFDSDAKVTAGAFMFVEQGSVNGDNGWVLTTDDPITLGGASGTSLVFTQFNSTGQITAGTGMSKSGSTLNVGGSSTIIANADTLDVNSSNVANQVLLSAGTVGVASAYGSLPLGDSNAVSGVLPFARGGTGAGSYTAGSRIVATNSGNTALVDTVLDPSQVVTLTDTQTLTNKTLTNPKISTNISDTNGNELLRFNQVSSAVNDVSLSNAATGSAPLLAASGDDTNIDLKLLPKGSGNVLLSGLKYPNADGSVSQVLKTDGAGNLQFTDVPILTVNSTTTTNATATALTTMATASSSVYTVESYVSSKNASASSGAGFILRAVFANNAGTLSKLGGEKTKGKSSGNTWDADLVVSGTNIVVQVTGQASTSVNWKATTRLTSV